MCNKVNGKCITFNGRKTAQTFRYIVMEVPGSQVFIIHFSDKKQRKNKTKQYNRVHAVEIYDN